MKKMLMTCVVALAGTFGVLHAQQLQQPLEEAPMSNQGYVLLKNGETVSGKIMNTSSTRGITQVTLRDESGEKRKFRADEIEEFLIAMNDAVRFQFANERGSSVKRLLTKRQPTAVPSDYVIYRNISLNGEKEMLFQLLNPDFEEAFEVYYDPQARKTTMLESEHISWTGDMHRAFLIRKGDAPPVMVKKGSYKKSFYELFGDCPQLLHLKKPDFKDLEAHLKLYNDNCSQGENSKS